MMEQLLQVLPYELEWPQGCTDLVLEPGVLQGTDHCSVKWGQQNQT